MYLYLDSKFYFHSVIFTKTKKKSITCETKISRFSSYRMIDQHHENVENVKADINLELSLGEVE